MAVLESDLHTKSASSCMAQMAAVVLTELRATASVLDHIRNFPEKHKAVSEKEARRIVAMMTTNPPGVVMSGIILDELKKVPFCSKDNEMLTHTVADLITNDEGGAAPAPEPVVAKASLALNQTQKWENCHVALTEQVWTDLQANDVTSMFTYLGELELRIPSEPTYRVMALCWLVASDGYEKTLRSGADVRLQSVLALKGMWKSFAIANLQAPPIGGMIWSLPATMEGLKVAHLHLYKAIFDDSGSAPAPVPCTSAQWTQLVNVTRCRASGVVPGAAPRAYVATAPDAQIQVPSAHGMQEPIQAMCSMMVACMQSMMQGSQRPSSSGGQRREAPREAPLMFPKNGRANTRTEIFRQNSAGTLQG